VVGVAAVVGSLLLLVLALSPPISFCLFDTFPSAVPWMISRGRFQTIACSRFFAHELAAMVQKILIDHHIHTVD